MKKALIKALLFAMTLVTLITVIPLPANASTSNKQKVFAYITEEMGLNSAAACGIMANIERESNFKPGTIIRDSNGLKSGGLCMWNGGRLSNLQNYCSKKGLDYLSVEGQMSYLEHELNQDYYKHILNYLKKVKNNSDGAYNAAYYWCYYFEIPANRSSKAVQRGNMAVKNYWPTYGNKKLDTPKISVSKTSLDLGSYVTLSWTSGGSNAGHYKLYVAKKLSNGKYDWTNAKIYWPKSLKQKIDTDFLGEGSFAAYVKAVNDATGGTSKASNTVKFSITCKTHSYTSKITKEPTLTKTGTKLYTCKQCGYKTTRSVAKVNYKTIGNYTMDSVVSTARTQDSITLSWDKYTGADGYFLYVREGDSWKHIATLKGDDNTSYVYDGLKSGREYTFTVKFYIKKGDNVYSGKPAQSYTTATQTDAPTLKSVTGKQGGKAILKWDSVKGADRYAVYVSESKKGGYEFLGFINNSKATSYTVKDLKPGAYYFRIRGVVSGDEHRVYSSYSNAKGAIVL